MAASKKTNQAALSQKNDPPANLKDHIFYGLDLCEEQKEFRDAIYSKDYDIVFCEAKAGSGKTLVSIATAILMCGYGMYDGITYVCAPTQEATLGFLPGTAADKISLYTYPVYDALYKIGEDPSRIRSNCELNIIQR